jgi:hypothetical protein
VLGGRTLQHSGDEFCLHTSNLVTRNDEVSEFRCLSLQVEIVREGGILVRTSTQ